VDATLGVVLKYQDDIAGVRGARAGAILASIEGGDRDPEPDLHPAATQR
jgi:hypothetical protein